MKRTLIIILLCTIIFITGCGGSSSDCIKAVEEEYVSFISLQSYHYIVKDANGNIFYIVKNNLCNTDTTYKCEITHFVKD